MGLGISEYPFSMTLLLTVANTLLRDLLRKVHKLGWSRGN